MEKTLAHPAQAPRSTIQQGTLRSHDGYIVIRLERNGERSECAEDHDRSVELVHGETGAAFALAGTANNLRTTRGGGVSVVDDTGAGGLRRGVVAEKTLDSVRGSLYANQLTWSPGSKW